MDKFHLCTLKAGTVVKSAGPGRIETTHPEDGWQLFEVIPDFTQPHGVRVVHTIMAPDTPVTIEIGHARD